MSNSDILLQFAPTFQSFGCEIGRKYLLQVGGGKVHGLCTGPVEVMNYVRNKLGSCGGQFWHLHTEEKKWLETEVTSERLAQIDAELGNGAFGRIMVADRRMGRGFVRGGLCRPSKIGKKVLHMPEIMPQKYILGLYEFLKNILKQAQPKVVFCYAVAGSPAVTLAELCKANGIIFTRFATTRIQNRFVIDSDIAARLECVAKKYQAANEGTENVDHKRQEAREILQQFRDNPEPPEYAKRNHALLQSKNPWKTTGWALLSTVYHTIQGVINRQDRSDRIFIKWFNAWIEWRKFLMRSEPFSENFPEDKHFVFYPLHVDPEASTMVLSPWHTDQINVIESLAKSVPSEMIVVVKEHAPMLGRRPRGFYKKISQIPRVVLLGPEHSGLSLVQQAKLTAVITGTAAWEAIRLGRPALIIGDSPFLAIGQGAFHEPCLANLPQSIPKALSLSPASDNSLELYIAACLAEGFSMPTSLLWGKYEDHPEKEQQQAVENIVEAIMNKT